MELEVGKKYTFKVDPGRGRPFVGEVFSISDDLVTLRNSRGEDITISKLKVIRPYEFKPYNTKNTRENIHDENIK